MRNIDWESVVFFITTVLIVLGISILGGIFAAIGYKLFV